MLARTSELTRPRIDDATVVSLSLIGWIDLAARLVPPTFVLCRPDWQLAAGGSPPATAAAAPAEPTAPETAGAGAAPEAARSEAASEASAGAAQDATTAAPAASSEDAASAAASARAPATQDLSEHHTGQDRAQVDIRPGRGGTRDPTATTASVLLCQCQGLVGQGIGGARVLGGLRQVGRS